MYSQDKTPSATNERPRVLITSDGEIDDECSLVRFLLYANEWEVEGIITSSSQYHWQGHKWAGDDWAQPYLQAYAKVYSSLLKHDIRYPTPDYLQSVTMTGNVSKEGEMDSVTPGSQHIVNVLLDTKDQRPVWIQAWGGTNTIARALKTIEEQYPGRMKEVAGRMRLYLIWEQDSTFQHYIRPHWEKFNIPTIISDQFIALFYHWKKYIPASAQEWLSAPWMKENILKGHGDLCSLYKAHTSSDKGFEEGDFRSEGDSPAFLHLIPNGLRSAESPDWGGWGGRFVRVRANTWLDPVHEKNYVYPDGRWYSNTAWGRVRLKQEIPNDTALTRYLEPTWRWISALQNDFAARADWCVKPFSAANHAPLVNVNGSNRNVKPGQMIRLDAKGTNDPDGNHLNYNWWIYQDAGTCTDPVVIKKPGKQKTRLIVPSTARRGQTIHIICEVKDNGTPALTSYQRVVLTIH